MSDPIATLTTATALPPQYISPSKHNRIDIWRTEVAAAQHASLSTSSTANSANPSPSIASSSSTGSSSSASNANFNPHDGSGVGHSRRPSIWRRLVRRLSGRSMEEGIKPEDIWDQDIRTDMYKEHPRTSIAAPGGIDVGDEDEDLDRDNSGHGGRGLLATKERLERAARLLERNV